MWQNTRSTHPKSLRKLMRKKIYKVINPITLYFAGRKGFPWAIVYHLGRRSGQTHLTPVFSTEATDGFVIPLPFGSGTDWCSNVLATKSFRLRFHGADYLVYDPEVVDAEIVWPELSIGLRLGVHILSLRLFLKAKLAPN